MHNFRLGMLLVLILAIPVISFSQNDCSGFLVRKAETMNALMKDFPEFANNNDENKKSLTAISPELLNSIRNQIDSYKNFDLSVKEKSCFQNNLTSKSRRWWRELFIDGPEINLFPKNAFKKGGLGLMTFKLTGVSGIFSDDESFLSTPFIRYGRSIGKKDKNVGRHFRWVLGAGAFRQEETIFTVVPGLQYNFKEIDVLDSPILSFIWEVNYMAGINQSLSAIETGISIEAFFFNLNLLTVGYQNLTDKIYFQSGIQLRLDLLFRKSKK